MKCLICGLPATTTEASTDRSYKIPLCGYHAGEANAVRQLKGERSDYGAFGLIWPPVGRPAPEVRRELVIEFKGLTPRGDANGQG